MRILFPYAYCLVLSIGIGECMQRHDYKNDTATFINVERTIKNIELELKHSNKFTKPFDIFHLKDKLEYLENLKNLLHHHLSTFLQDKWNLFQKPPTTKPPTTTNIISTTSDETATESEATSTMMPTTTGPVPCYQANDLAVVVDASGSVGYENFKISLEFAARLLSTWKLYEKNGVSSAVFASSVVPIMSFDQGSRLDQNEVQMAILSAPYIATGTASHLALDWGLSEHLSNNSTVNKNLVFLTDGLSNDPKLTLEAAKRLARQRIHVFAVGIGPEINQEELVSIADNQKTRVFTTDGFHDLLDLLKPVSEIICA